MPDVDLEASQRRTLERVFPGGVFARPLRLSGGISAGATRWDVTLADGGKTHVVVRAPSSKGSASSERVLVEARVLRLLEHAAIPAPRLRGMDVEASRLVLEYLEGAPCFTVPLSDDATAQLARSLAAVHRVTPLTHDLSFLPSREQSVERMLEQRPSVCDDSLAESRVRDALLARRPPNWNPPVLLHGDFWPGNVLWHQGQLRALIDWEEAEVGDPLADLAIARLDLLWAFGERVMQRFTELWLEMSQHVWREQTVEHLAWWDLVAALRPMSALSAWASVYGSPPISRPDVTAEHMSELHRSFVAQALARWHRP